MAKDGTPEEHRAKLAAAMGEELGVLFSDLGNEFAWARSKWQEYEELFGTSEKIELLNKAAPAFFGSLHETLRDDILLHLCRLTDRAEIMGHETLSLEQLTKAIADACFVTELKPYLSDVREKTQAARDFRNKCGAHTDLKVVRGEEVLPGICVRESLEAIHVIFEKVRDRYKLPNESFEVFAALGGVDALLACLARGVKAREEELARLRTR